ncbi:ABC transporter substrate-binding protein [Paenibacillus daejeonensis]|uniref:ABC transporter substrate-binding protein n=1 Tax=Paenibacillus daejeonensis TaxID=135193 RepID=UPI0003827B39|nr:sugar ABC transporter substrate-binding protein [Paenibacillus daejeonensis]
MMKKWAKVSTIALMAISLAACSSGNANNSGGSNNSAPSNNESGTNGEAVKLNFWTMDRHDMEFMQEKVDAFNSSNTDNIEVEMTVMADNYNQALEVAFSSNQAPDIFKVYDFVTGVKKGYMTPLDDLMSDEFKAQFESVLAENVNMLDGKIYSLPNTGQYWRLIYNKDLFEQAGLTEAPKTLDEMVEAAKKITEVGKADGAYGFASNFKNGSGFTRPAWAIATLSKGEGLEGYNINKGEFDFNVYREVAEALHQMKEDGSMMPGVETLDIDPLRAQFAQGKIGMYINHSSEPAVYTDQFPTDVNWEAAVVPSIDGNPQGALWVNAGNYLAISEKTPHKEAAFKFMEYLYGTELRAEYQEEGYGISVLPYVNEAANEPELNGISGFLPTENDAIYPASPAAITESRLEGLKATDALIRYILTGGDLDATINDLNTRYNQALEAVRSDGSTTIEADPSFNANDLRGSLVVGQ